MRIGDLEVEVLQDGSARGPADMFGVAENSAHADMVHDGHIELPIACFLVRTAGKTVLIDAGMGPTVFDWTPKPGRNMRLEGGKLPAALARVGVSPEDIDLILPTHMHQDHGGWIIAHGAPFFPNAVVRFGAGDWDAVVETSKWEGHAEGMRALRAAGRVELIEHDGEVAPGIAALATPGHTPGHQCYVLSSGGQRAMILGDIISCPLQIEAPEREALADMDKQLSIATRDRILRELDGETLVGGPHFPGLRFGRVLMGEGRRYWS
ncbi:MBL fold metallo-hydrolase [Phenylobacterium sp.]|jgi:glyoxylase-like metal-dependent hydrolase (beta-lactamase superfamily II)|uniref:MBL fold metallo-hydrolase n=1 Tax=Phenylobacterium sp. TaxID=1871053 RepID=UPI002F4158F3